MTNKQITRIRLQLFGTQAVAAEACGVTPGAWSHFETGRRPVPRYVEIILAHIRSQTHPTA